MHSQNLLLVGPNPQIHIQHDVIKIFQTETLYMEQKYLRMEHQKPGAWISA